MIGRHTELAACRHQQRAMMMAVQGRIAADLSMGEYKNSALYFQRESAIEYATARKLMGVEE